MRTAVRRMLQVNPSYQICAEAETVARAFSNLKRFEPDLLIMDFPAEPGDAIELLQRIKAEHPDCAVLVLSLHKETLFAEDALRAGAQGYLMKNDAADFLLDAVHDVLDGKIYVSEAVRQNIYSHIRTDSLRRLHSRRSVA